jgi:hypothetical protein
MLLEIHQHVNDPVPRFAGRSKRARMVPILPDGPSPPRNAVHRKRKSYRGSHDAAREPDLVVGFDEEVNVVGLHGKMDDPKPASGGAPDGPSQLDENELLPQARQPMSGPKCDVDRMCFLVLRPWAVRDASAPGRAFATGSAPLSAQCRELQLLLAPTFHLIGAINV